MRAVATHRWRVHVRGDARFSDAGAVVFDYGNNLRPRQRSDGGVADAFDYPGLRARLHPPAVLRGEGAVPLGRALGRSRGHRAHRRAVAELFPDDEHLQRWLTLARERVAFQGLPARICWLGYGERAEAGLAFNELVATGEMTAPIVIGRDHLDSG